MHSTSALRPVLERSDKGFGFAVVNLGCKVNRVESDSITAAFLSLGGAVASGAGVDIAVVNTCTVTGEADKKARKAVRKALSDFPRAQVVVTGCAVAVDAATYEALGSRVFVAQRTQLMEQLSDAARESPLRMGGGFRTRVSIKVQDGCDHACSFCIVHVARGRAVSVPSRTVLAEARAYLKGGAKEIVLAGIDLGSYRDPLHADGSYRLAQLVEDLICEADSQCAPGTAPARVRASSLEPITVDEDLVRLLETSDGRLCRHVHLPLQSGSSKVLAEMRRPYTADAFLDTVAELRSRVPEISITTDIICGFPGETEDDFNQSLEVARECGFSKLHVFPYSRRVGTPAAERADQVPPDVKHARAEAMRQLSDELRRTDLQSRSGTTELAVVEGKRALSESYHEVAAPHGVPDGALVPVRL